jgi:DNA end-binding protein Ku
MRSIWSGAISFGLVSIPVQLFTATEERGVPLHQFHATDGGRIRYRRVCAADGQEIDYGEIAKGYELPDGRVVVLTDEDFAALPLSSSRTIDVLSFVDADSVDPIRISRGYYCEPTALDPKPYHLLRTALERTGKSAVVKVAIRQRESLALLRPRGWVLVLQLLLWPDEVREPRFPFLDEEVVLRPQELQMAESYVNTLTGEVDDAETVDRYRVALEELVEAKVAGLPLEPPPMPVADTGEAVDLMEALRRSVEQAQRDRDGGPAGGRPARKAPAKKAPAKKAPAKKATAKQTAATQNGVKPAKKAATKRTAAKQGR